jgi:hypothetical protein
MNSYLDTMILKESLIKHVDSPIADCYPIARGLHPLHLLYIYYNPRNPIDAFISLSPSVSTHTQQQIGSGRRRLRPCRLLYCNASSSYIETSRRHGPHTRQSSPHTHRYRSGCTPAHAHALLATSSPPAHRTGSAAHASGSATGAAASIPHHSLTSCHARRLPTQRSERSRGPSQGGAAGKYAQARTTRVPSRR